MAEYIDRSAAVSILRAKANMSVLMDVAPYFEKAAQMLEKIPAADVAPVVRCKGCKYGTSVWSGSVLCGHPEYDLLEGVLAYGEDHFCSYGAKMDGER